MRPQANNKQSVPFRYGPARGHFFCRIRRGLNQLKRARHQRRVLHGDRWRIGRGFRGRPDFLRHVIGQPVCRNALTDGRIECPRCKRVMPARATAISRLRIFNKDATRDLRLCILAIACATLGTPASPALDCARPEFDFRRHARWIGNFAGWRVGTQLPLNDCGR